MASADGDAGASAAKEGKEHGGAGGGAGGPAKRGILASGDGGAKRPKTIRKKAGIVWDEQTIAEHDKERGTRMKIDEPKTPYHLPDEGGSGGAEPDAFSLGDPSVASDAASGSGGGAGAVSADALSSRLEQHRDGAKGEWDTSSDEDDAPESAEAEAKAKAFAAKRAAHYNEAQKLAEFRRKLAAGELSDDDDDDDDDDADS